MIENLTERQELIEENIEVMKQYILRPLRKYEDKLIFTGWMEGNYSELLSRAMTYARKVDYLVLKELRHGYIYNSNIIVFITGTMGSGKSTLARSVAIQLREYCRKYLNRNRRIHITFSNDESNKAVKRMKQGDILIQDEIGRQSGTDSLTVLKSIYNIQEQIRQEQLSFIFLSPTLKGQINACNLLLEAWGIDYESGHNRYRVYSGYTGKPLGWGEIPYLKDHEIERFYNFRKTEHVKRLQRLGGASTVIWDKKEIERDAKRLVTAAIENTGCLRKFPKDYLKTLLSYGEIEVAGSEKKLDAIAGRAKAIAYEMMMKQETKKKEKKKVRKEMKGLAKKGQLAEEMTIQEITRTYGEHNFTFTLINKEENNKIPEIMLKDEHIDEVKLYRKFKKLKPHHFGAWRMFHIEGIDASGIARHYKKTRASILNKYNKQGWLAVFDTEIAGYLAEYAVHEVYYPELKIYGGKGEPDLCDNIDNPSIMVEIKKRDEHKTPVINMLSREELESLLDGVEVHLVILIMIANKTVVEQYRVGIKK